MKKIKNKTKEEFLDEIELLKAKVIELEKEENYISLREKKLDLIFETVPYAVNLINKEGILLDCNKSLLNLFGYKNKDELIGRSYSILFPEFEIERTKKDIEIVQTKGTAHELLYTLKRKDGTTFPAEISSSSYIDKLNNELLLVSAANDISERVKSEEKFQESEKKYRFLYESNPMPMSIFDSNTLNFLSVNNAFIDKYGYSKEEFMNMTILEIRPDSEKDKLLQSVKLKDKGVTNAGVFIHKKKNGELIQVEIIRQEFILEGKNVKLVLVNDITNQKQLEYERNLAHQSFLNTLENMTDGFVSLDKNWNYTYVNKIAGTMFGKNPEDLIEKHIWTEFPEGINQPFYKNYYKAVETNEPINFEDYYQPWDKWFENRVIPSENGLSIFFHDITDRKKTELELQKHKEQLEEVVKERTKEIQDKNKTLERLNKIFVGRELRMKELKNKIAELEKKTN